MHPGIGGPYLGRIHQACVENALNAHQKSRQQTKKYTDQSISSNVKKLSEKGTSQSNKLVNIVANHA